MPLKIFIIIFFFIIAIGDILNVKNNRIKLRYFTKSLLIPLLILFYLISTTKIEQLIIYALICCFFGDFFLLFARKKLFFIAGLLSFFAGHFFYIIAFLKTTSFLSNIPGWFYLSLIPYIFYGFFIYYRLNPYLSSMKIPVIAYLNVILFMSFASFTRIWEINGIAFWFPFVGSIMFIVSDTLLAIRVFKYNIMRGWISVMIFYICAQLLIILGLLK